MEDRKTLRRLSESLRAELTREMDERAAWGCMFDLALARIRSASPPRERRGPTARAGSPGRRRGARSESVAAAKALLWDSAREPRITAALADPTALGWLHQYWVNAEKAKVAAKLRRKAGDTIGGDELIAATCVYSSREQVRFLLQNSLGRVWLGMRPRSRLRGQWEYSIEGAPRVRRRSVEEVTVFDPACGCGHFLIEAMGMLFEMYREEQPRRSAASICGSILSQNLFGLDIDSRAIRVAKSAMGLLAERLGGQTQPRMNVERVGGLGALREPKGRSRVDAMLRRRYSIIATNPPFVGFRKLSPAIKKAIMKRERLAASDMASAFVSRGCAMLEEDGLLAVVTPAAWLTSRPALPLRRHLVERGGPCVVAMLGQHVFETAPLLFVSLVVLGHGDGKVAMVTSKGDADLRPAAAGATRCSVSRIRDDPSCSFAPSAAMLPLSLTTRPAMTGDFFAFADGLWTGDTARDTRAWEDVDADDPRWLPASGGHGYCRWYGPVVRVIRASAALRWPHLDRREGCLEYSRVAGGRLAARMVLSRCAAIAGVVSMFRREGADDRRDDVLAVFNSRVGTLWLRGLASGLNFNAGYAARVPLPNDGFPPAVRELVSEAVRLRRSLAGGRGELAGEAGAGWRQRLEWERRLFHVERDIDVAAADAHGIRERDLRDIVLPPQTFYEASVRVGKSNEEIEGEARRRLESPQTRHTSVRRPVSKAVAFGQR